VPGAAAQAGSSTPGRCAKATTHGCTAFNQRANFCSEHTSPFCRIPLLTLLYNTIGFEPWRPDAVSGTVPHNGKIKHEAQLPGVVSFKSQYGSHLRNDSNQSIPGIEWIDSLPG